jgi:hypothetical protein
MRKDSGDTGKLQLETGVGPDVRAELERRGHHLADGDGSFGGYQAIMRDPTTGVYWASDAYASPVPQATAFVDELDDEFWRDSFPTFQAWLAPWTSMVDRDAWLHACARVEKLRPRVIAGTHSPTIAGAQVADALAMMRAVPAAPATPQPDQAVLDHILGAWRS